MLAKDTSVDWMQGNDSASSNCEFGRGAFGFFSNFDSKNSTCRIYGYDHEEPSGKFAHAMSKLATRLWKKVKTSWYF
jgi:hypothetical protein